MSKTKPRTLSVILSDSEGSQKILLRRKIVNVTYKTRDVPLINQQNHLFPGGFRCGATTLKDKQIILKRGIRKQGEKVG